MIADHSAEIGGRLQIIADLLVAVPSDLLRQYRDRAPLLTRPTPAKTAGVTAYGWLCRTRGVLTATAMLRTLVEAECERRGLA